MSTQQAGPHATTPSPEVAAASQLQVRGTRAWTATLGARIRAQISPGALREKHLVFTIAFVLSLIPRILELFSFRPALLSADSFVYMQQALNHQLGTIRPSGYPFFLSILGVLPHPLTIVVVVQHLMGLAIAVLVYSLLRYWGLPGWGAALATLPTLFDTREITLESYILPDTLFCLVIVVVVALLITKQTPRAWQCVTAALLLAYVSVLRGNGILLAVVVAAFLLVRKVGWRALIASAAAFGIPLLGYALVFHSEHGEFNLTSSDGIFLWSRMTTFANCKVIDPPADLRPLCPSSERPENAPPSSPAFSISNELVQKTPSDYLWASDAWWRTDSQPGFNRHNNTLGLRFAVKAVESQPLSYLRAASRDVLLTFIATDRPQDQADMYLTPNPRIAHLPSYYVRYERAYAGMSQNTHAVYPYANLMFDYQQPLYFPGIVFLLVILTGIAGAVRNWRGWGGVLLLPVGLAVVSILSPALLSQSLYRYAIAAIPLACIAAGLSLSRLCRPASPSVSRQPATVPGDTGPLILP